MTARHSTLFTLESGNSGLGFYTTQRDAAAASRVAIHHEAVELRMSSELWEMFYIARS